MRNTKKSIILILTFLLMLCPVSVFSTEVMAKTSTVTIDLTGGSAPVKRPAKLKNARKVKITNSKKSVVKVKYLKSNKDKRIQFTGKKVGTAKVKVKCYLKGGKTKTYSYKVKVKRSKKKTDLELAKEAFKIQNEYRAEKGVAALEWSDELYEFCLYRLKTSGFDEHKNLGRDMNDYFGGFAGYKDLMFGENLHIGKTEPKAAMESWKDSPGHYSNLLKAEHKCGAIAKDGITWCAIFYDGDKSDFIGWDQIKIKKITVKRYDEKTGAFLNSCDFAYYEDGNKSDTMKVGRIKRIEGKDVYLDPDKTYVFYERIAPDGYTKAASVKIDVTMDGPDEVILK
ncbi:MAG: CAP domain-containing protein [Lachnospiraceae bacterium]|nr:CAP domain-containing protein [Lachnospiraceae bacterium]